MRHFYLSASFVSTPNPVQDLKPVHIILCGDQVKLLDFGIASFFTGFGKNFQLYGTSRYWRTGNPARTARHSGLPTSTVSAGF